MRVAFWCAFPQVGGVTGNLAAIATACTLYFNRRVVIGSNHFSSRGVERCFGGEAAYQKNGQKTFCYCYGEAEYFRILWEEYGPAAGVYAPRQLSENLYLIQPPDMLAESLFCDTVPKEMLYFMDVAGNRQGDFGRVLEEADLVAVFLPQELDQIKQFFDCYSSLIPKSVFFVNDFSRRCCCVPGKLSKKFGIDRQCISTIPHNEEFAVAYEEGRVGEFIRDNLFCLPEEENYRFIRQIISAAELLLEYEKGE